MGILAILRRDSSRKDDGTETEKTLPTSRFRGVEIVADPETCCGAVSRLSGKRMLSHEVPKLPLDECTAVECRCTYQLFDDRRTDVRRTADEIYDIASVLYEDDQRDLSQTGRRKSDRKRVRQ